MPIDTAWIKFIRQISDYTGIDTPIFTHLFLNFPTNVSNKIIIYELISLRRLVFNY